MEADACTDCGEIALRCMEIWGGNREVDQGVSVPGIDVRVVSRPCEGAESGGDIYYVSQCGAGNIARVALADVAGHGSAVSELATSLQKLMRKHINTVDQTAFARALNREFDAVSAGSRFATAILATYWAPTDHLVLVNAGHPPPLRYRAETGAWSFIERGDGDARSVGAGNLPLGIIEPTEYEQFAVSLAVGDVVVLYTDAMIEACDADGRLLGREGLLGVARGIGPVDRGTIAEELRARVSEFRGGSDAGDDETVIVLAHNGAAPPRMSVGEKLGAIGRMMGIGSVWRG